MIAARVFAVLAAVFLVAAVGLAFMLPAGLPLAEALMKLEPSIATWLRGHSGAWGWTWVVAPLLQRPVWLLPASFGLVAAGLALTFNLGKEQPSRRRRS